MSKVIDMQCLLQLYCQTNGILTIESVGQQQELLHPNASKEDIICDKDVRSST